ncbi:MAG: MFS transporter [Anaerolineales bacterium]|nr:MFS transporter [Anaerolineales bacterium]
MAEAHEEQKLMAAPSSLQNESMNPGTGSARPAPLLNNMLLLFLVTMVLANIAGHMYTSLLPLYLKELNASVVQVGLFFTLLQIVPLALQILGGWISDSLGRLRSIALGSMAGLLSYVGLILAPTWQWVLLGEGLAAITRSLVGPSFGAFIAEQSAEEHRARVFGISEGIFMVVNVVGPPLGGLLAGRYGFKYMLLVAAVLYGIATLLRVGMAKVAARGQEANPQRLTFSSLRLSLGAMVGMVLAGGLITWILLTDGVRDVAYALSFNLLPLYLQDIGGLNITQIGLLESIFGLAMMAIIYPAGWLADKRGEKLGIAFGFGLQFLALMVFIRTSGFWGYASAWMLLGFGVGMMSPAYQSLISKAVPDHLRGTAFGLFQTSLGIISLPAPALGAQLWERVSPRFPFGVTAVLSLVAILPVSLKFKTPKNGVTANAPTD